MPGTSLGACMLAGYRRGCLSEVVASLGPQNIAGVHLMGQNDIRSHGKIVFSFPSALTLAPIV